MEHLENEESANLAIEEMDRVLKKGSGLQQMFHKITVIGEEGIDADATHHIKWPSSRWERWFSDKGWNVQKPTSHRVPIWSKKGIGLYPVKGAFYLKRD